MPHWSASARKVVCVGRNFAKHARELGNAVPTEPVLFLKPPSAAIVPGAAIEVPRGCENLHHEVELAVIIGRAGRDIPRAQARQHVRGYGLALDMTARSVQTAAKKAGLPWSVAKGCDTFLPLSRDLIPDSPDVDPTALTLWLAVDGIERQRGTTADMMWPVDALIAHISGIMRLEEGDIILTGTPEGVGPVFPGQTIECGVEELGLRMSFPVEVRATPRL